MANIELLTQERQERLITTKGKGELRDLIVKADKMQGLCEDIIINSKDAWINPDIQLSHLEGSSKGLNEIHKNADLNSLGFDYDLTQYSFSQLCTKFGVPVRYMKKCLEANELELVQENINKWLHKKDNNKKLMIRTYDDRIRGVLSDKYSRMDAPEILSNVYNVTSENLD